MPLVHPARLRAQPRCAREASSPLVGHEQHGRAAPSPGPKITSMTCSALSESSSPVTSSASSRSGSFASAIADRDPLRFAARIRRGRWSGRRRRPTPPRAPRRVRPPGAAGEPIASSTFSDAVKNGTGCRSGAPPDPVRTQPRSGCIVQAVSRPRRRGSALPRGRESGEHRDQRRLAAARDAGQAGRLASVEIDAHVRSTTRSPCPSFRSRRRTGATDCTCFRFRPVSVRAPLGCGEDARGRRTACLSSLTTSALICATPRG